MIVSTSKRASSHLPRCQGIKPNGQRCIKSGHLIAADGRTVCERHKEKKQ